MKGRRVGTVAARATELLPVSAAKVADIDPIARSATEMVTEGGEIFRHNPAGSIHSGVGPGSDQAGARRRRQGAWR
jgi:hypothetical protein